MGFNPANGLWSDYITHKKRRIVKSPGPIFIRLNGFQILAFAWIVFFTACEPHLPLTFAIVDNGQVKTLITYERVPIKLLTEAGIVLGSTDKILINGYEVQSDQPLPYKKDYTLQIRRAAGVNINGHTTSTTALTIGEALSDLGYSLYIQDKFDPPADGLITGNITINYFPSQDFILFLDHKQVHIRSANTTVGKVLADGGFPLMGLDSSQPEWNDTIPEDHQIRLFRVSEAIVLSQKSIPYRSETVDSSELELGQQVVMQPGQTGLSVSRTRIRYEDGDEVARTQDVESVVRPPQTRIIGTGTKVVINSITISGVSYKYWRSMKMYATSYSPCRSGVPGQCFDGTKSGLPLQKGVIAVDPSTYDFLVGQNVFIPGYGKAVVGDIGGGYIIEKELGIPRELWIDLGYNDSNYQDAPGWVEVYFLEPVPATIPAFMK